MIIVTAVIQAKDGREQELETVLLALVNDVSQEEGALEYRLHKSRTVPGKFYFYEKYTGQAALDEHNSTPYFKALGGKIAPLLKAEPEIDTFELLDGIPEGEEHLFK